MIYIGIALAILAGILLNVFLQKKGILSIEKSLKILSVLL